MNQYFLPHYILNYNLIRISMENKWLFTLTLSTLARRPLYLFKILVGASGRAFVQETALQETVIPICRLLLFYTQFKRLS